MAGRRRAGWSSNEYFAHKKNVGEGVKLKYQMVTIERQYGLIKDSMKHKFSEARMSLKTLRKSSGHSIDALPPTPFQSHPGRASASSVSLPVIDASSDELPPEYRYLEQDVESQSGFVFVDHARIGRVYPNIRQIYPSELDSPQTDDHSPQRSTHPNDERVLYSKSPDGERYYEQNCQTVLPSLDTGRNSALLVTRNRKMEEDWTANLVKERSCNELELLPSIKKCFGVGNETQKHHEPLQHKRYIRSLTPRLQRSSGESKRSVDELKDQSCARQHTFYPDTKAEHEPVTESIRLPDDNTCQSKESFPRSTTINASRLDKSLSTNKERRSDVKEKNFMRDIRTRCRTCRERFRQNAEFQRMKKTKEEQENIQRQSEKFSMEKKIGPKDKLVMVSIDDVESVLSDEVLDFDEQDIRLMRRKTYHCKKGYSRKRMEELAKPKAGRKRKLLFSKQLIRKEVDSLIESHSLPLLTEKEKERIRMLESKIRMFLAMMQNSPMPSKMVDIPQREDIMKVDISHH